MPDCTCPTCAYEIGRRLDDEIEHPLAGEPGHGVPAGPKVGVGRKQLLIANGVTTAADVDRNRIRNISGFGDALTGNVIAWRDEVLRQFRFDPRSGVSPADHRVLAVRFRARQQTLLSDAERVLGQLERLAPYCKAALTKLEPDLRTAVAEWEQADADLRVLTKRG